MSCPGYVIQRKIGAGGFGEVFLVKRKSDRQVCVFRSCHEAADNLLQLFAMKTLQLTKRDGPTLESFRQEIVLLQHLSHPHIVECIEVVERGTSAFIIMEYCSHGDLRAVIDSAAQTK